MWGIKEYTKETGEYTLPLPAERKRRRSEISIFCVVVLLHIFKFSFMGFEYFPYLDDYVQYGLYPYLPNVWSDILTGGPGIIFSRPFAVLFDTFVWGNFWGCLWLAVIIIAVVAGVTGVLFIRFFERMDIPLSPLFVVIFLFSPLNFEGTYWLSASSRVVMSLFFSALSLHELLDYCRGKKLGLAESGTYRLVTFSILNLISYGFYEQTIVLSFCLIAFVIMSKKAWRAAFPTVLNLVLIASFYIFFLGLSNNSDRMTVISFAEIPSFTATVAEEVYSIFVTNGSKIFTRGFMRGLAMIEEAERSGILWAAVGAVLCVVYAVFSGSGSLARKGFKNLKLKKPSYTIKRFLFEVLLGAILFFATFTPFIANENKWLNFRNLVAPSIGLGLVIDSVFRLLVRNRRVQSIIAAAVLALFMIMNVSELYDYHKIAQDDYALAAELAQEYYRTGSENLQCKKPQIDYKAQNVLYHDHIVSHTDSGWGFSGAVRGLTHKKNIVVEFIE